MNAVRVSPIVGRCVRGVIAIRPDGLEFALASSETIDVFCCSSLVRQKSFPTPRSVVAKILFSSDECQRTEYLVWTRELNVRIFLIHLRTGNQFEIDVDPVINLVYLSWQSSVHSQYLVFVSELEIYVGGYDVVKQTNVVLTGCALDSSGDPLLAVSPDRLHICFSNGTEILIYSTTNWNLKAKIDFLGRLVSPIFTSSVTFFVTNSQDVNEWYSIFGSKLKKEPTQSSTAAKLLVLSNNQRRLFAVTYDDRLIAYDPIKMAIDTTIGYMAKVTSNMQMFSATENCQQMGTFLVKFYDRGKFNGPSLVRNVFEEFKCKTTSSRYLMRLNYDDSLMGVFSPSARLIVWIWDLTGRPQRSFAILLPKELETIKELSWHPQSNCLAILTSNSLVVWMENAGVISLSGGTWMNFKWIRRNNAAIGLLLTKEDDIYLNRFVFFGSLNGSLASNCE